MTDEGFDREFEDTWRRLERERGVCPDPELLAATEPNPKIEAHVEMCGVCAELRERLRAPEEAVRDFTWKKAERALDRKPAPWRPSRASWRMPLIAAALVATVGPALWFATRTTGSTAEPVERGSSIQLLEPAGRVDHVDLFRWSALPGHASFRVRILSGETLVREVSVSEPRYRPDDVLKRLLKPNTTFRWKVQGLDDRGQVLEESGWTAFEQNEPGEDRRR